MVLSRSLTAPWTRSDASGPGHVTHRALELHARREQSLDDGVVQVAGDPVAVAEQAEMFGLATLARQLETKGGLIGEGLEHGLMRSAETAAADEVANPEHAMPGLSRDERHDDDRSKLVQRLGVVRPMRALVDVVDRDRGATEEGVADQGRLWIDASADDVRGGCALGDLDHEAVAERQHNRGEVSLREVSGTAATSCSTSSGSLPESRAVVTSADACNQRSRCRTSS